MAQPAKPGTVARSLGERNDTLSLGELSFGEKDGATEAPGDVANAAIADLTAQEDLVISAGDRIFEESRHQPGSDPAPLPARLDGKGGFRAPASRIQRMQFSDTAHDAIEEHGMDKHAETHPGRTPQRSAISL